jgi:hypothetical protein
MLVDKWNYGQYSTGNYGAHTQAISMGSLFLYFSYDTVVAFSDGEGRRVCENIWSTTTGKHLNWIDGGNPKGRIKADEFNRQLEEALRKHDLVFRS